MSRLVLLLAVGCTASVQPEPEPVAIADTGDERVDQPADPQERLTQRDATPRIMFQLEHASLAEVSRLLREVSGLRVVLDVGVDRAAECLTITVVEPNPVTVDEAIAIARRAFAPAGVELEQGADELVFSRAEGAELAPCPIARLRTSRTPAATSAPAQAPAPPSPAARRARIMPTIRAGVRSVSANEVLITRAALDEALANQAVIFERVRVIPHEENGRVVAVKMYGIRRTSLMGLLGFLNGDGLQSVNGYALTSPETALEAYARLRSETELRVQLQRRGQTVTHTIRVVDALP